MPRCYGINKARPRGASQDAPIPEGVGKPEWTSFGSPGLVSMAIMADQGPLLRQLFRQFVAKVPVHRERFPESRKNFVQCVLIPNFAQFRIIDREAPRFA